MCISVFVDYTLFGVCVHFKPSIIPSVNITNVYMLITLCSVCVLASGRVIGDTTVINCLGQTSSPSSRSSSHGCRHPRRHRPHHPRHRQQPNHHHKLHYLQKINGLEMSIDPNV